MTSYDPDFDTITLHVDADTAAQILDADEMESDDAVREAIETIASRVEEVLPEYVGDAETRVVRSHGLSGASDVGPDLAAMWDRVLIEEVDALRAELGL